MSLFRKVWGGGAFLAAITLGACVGHDQLVGSDGQAAGSAGAAGNSAHPGTFAATIDGNAEGACLTFPLPVDDNGAPTCRLLSVRTEPGCSCAAAGLAPASSADRTVETGLLQTAGVCDGKAQQRCSDVCICDVLPATGTDLEQCQTAADVAAGSTGWCYVSTSGGTASEKKLLDHCSLDQTNEIRFLGDALPAAGETVALVCDGRVPYSSTVHAALGDPCASEDEYFTGFRGYLADEVAIHDPGGMCGTNLCIQNHFQGRASCPYGQAAGSADCLVLGSKVPVEGPVLPQRVARQAAEASICSCQCDGEGPGPYCTCPESMQCEHLVDDLGLGGSQYAGSYCIPKGSQYDPSATNQSVCTDPNCGDAHPY